MFMMAAGLAFGITTFRAWELHAKPSRAMLRRVFRYSLIVGIGYYLHLPHFSLRALSEATPAQVDAFLKVDALHVIGATLIATELLAPLARRRGAYVGVIAALGLATILLAPTMAALPAETVLPRALAAYVNHRTGSIFPMFPWTGYLCAGIIAAHFIQRWIDRGETAELVPRLAAWAAVLVVTSAAIYGVVPWGRGDADFWQTSPLLVAFRIGVILLFLAGLTALFARPSEGSVRRLVDVIGMETLVVYVLHLLVLYGVPGFGGLHHAIGRTQTVPTALFVFATLFVVTSAIAVAWHAAKKRRPKAHFIARMALLVAAVIYALVAS
jgi:hypothetical protein